MQGTLTMLCPRAISTKVSLAIIIYTLVRRCKVSITKTVVNADSNAVTGVSWYPADKSDFVLVDAFTNGESREAVFQRYLDTDGVDVPHTVRVGYYPKVIGGKPAVNLSIKASHHVQITDSVSGLDAMEPYTVTLAITGPGRSGGLDSADALTAILNLVSWIAPLTSGQFGTTALAQLQLGIVNQLNLLTD